MILIDVVYLDSEGGRALLNYMLSYINNRKKEYFILSDIRLYTVVLKFNLPFISVQASEFQRRKFYTDNLYKFKTDK